MASIPDVPRVLPVPPVAPVAPVPPLPPDADVFAMERHAAQMERHAERLERQAERLAAHAEREMAFELHRMERQIEREAARMEALANRHVFVHSGGSNAQIVLASSPASVIQTIRSVPREIVLAMLWFWTLGALAVGLMWAVAYSAAARAVRLGTPETDEDRLATWERIRILSGVTRPVRLLRSPALDVPIAWGWGEAAVVLPESADGWDDDRMEAVLLHELAHVIRRDAVSQLVAQIALVVHWANPLAWLAYRNFLLEREHACDDVVLEHGARPSAYAGHLVQVARDLRRRSAALAAVAPMARHSDLEGRVLSILDPARKRTTLSRAAGATLTLFLCGIALPVAALQPVAATAEESPEPEETVLATAPAVPIVETAWEVNDAENEPELAPLDIEEGIAEMDASALAMQFMANYPQEVTLALDTIPRFEDVIRPALDAALEALRAMRTSEQNGRLNFSDEDWDEMEETIRESIEEARENYDEAIHEAIEEALEDMEDEAWDVSWSNQPDGARVEGYTSEAALSRARRDVERAQRDAQQALRQAHQNVEHQLRNAEREQQRAQQRNHQRATESRVRAENRARTDARRSTNQGYSYSYSVSDGGLTISQSNGSTAAGWLAGLDGLNKGLDNIERSLSELERTESNAHPSTLAGLSSGLSGIHTGLTGIATAAQAWNGDSDERRRIKQRVDRTQDRLKDLKERLEECGD